MSTLSLKQKLMAIIAIVGTVLILIFQRGLYSKNESPTAKETKSEQTQTGSPDILTTNPSPLNDATILPPQPIELTFNTRLVNEPEFKHSIEPKVEYKLKLSDDHKTVQIIPNTAFQLGTTYTLLIKPETKFEGDKNLGREIIYHFKTIEYKGI